MGLPSMEEEEEGRGCQVIKSASEKSGKKDRYKDVGNKKQNISYTQKFFQVWVSQSRGRTGGRAKYHILEGRRENYGRPKIDEKEGGSCPIQ